MSLSEYICTRCRRQTPCKYTGWFFLSNTSHLYLKKNYIYVHAPHNCMLRNIVYFFFANHIKPLEHLSYILWIERVYYSAIWIISILTDKTTDTIVMMHSYQLGKFRYYVNLESKTFQEEFIQFLKVFDLSWDAQVKIII